MFLKIQSSFLLLKYSFAPSSFLSFLRQRWLATSHKVVWLCSLAANGLVSSIRCCTRVEYLATCITRLLESNWAAHFCLVLWLGYGALWANDRAIGQSIVQLSDDSGGRPRRHLLLQLIAASVIRTISSNGLSRSLGTYSSLLVMLGHAECTAGIW